MESRRGTPHAVEQRCAEREPDGPNLCDSSQRKAGQLQRLAKNEIGSTVCQFKRKPTVALEEVFSVDFVEIAFELSVQELESIAISRGC